MQINIDKSSGFCWGVVRAISMIESELKDGNKLFSLGDIIHNNAEIERLKSQGVETITHEDLQNLSGKKILIRAHGEPPETFELAKKYNITVVNATCPVVAKVQERIKRFYDDGFQVVIFGKKEHAEVIGLLGYTKGEAIVIKSIDEINKIDFSKKTVLFSQTTMDKPMFYKIKEEMLKKISNLVVDSIEFYAKDTICGQVFGREKKICEFSSEHDLVIFVAGRHSSNAKVLYELAKSVNPNIYFIEDVDEIKKEWFININKVGITGSTSTPQWLMEKVKSYIENMITK